MVILPRSTVDFSGAAKSNISVGAYVLRSTNCLTASSLKMQPRQEGQASSARNAHTLCPRPMAHGAARPGDDCLISLSL